MPIAVQDKTAARHRNGVTFIVIKEIDGVVLNYLAISCGVQLQAKPNICKEKEVEQFYANVKIAIRKKNVNINCFNKFSSYEYIFL